MRNLVTRSFLLCLLVLALAEIILRCTLPPLSVAAFEYGHSPTAGFVETTNGMVQLEPGPTRDFHAQKFPRERPAGELRIFTFGSSVEYWDAVASHILSNTYPAVLGMQLTKRGRRTESINFGVTGYGTLRNEVLLRQAINYQPSLIILKLDVTNEGVDQATARRAADYKSWLPQNWLWKSYLVQMGLFLKETRLLEHTLPPSILNVDNARTVRKKSPAGPFNVVSRQAIAECLKLARDHQVPVLLLTQAYVVHRDDGRSVVDDYGLDAFAATQCGPGVTMFSLKEFLSPLPVETAFADHVHLSRPAHQLLADRLADEVLKLFPAAP